MEWRCDLWWSIGCLLMKGGWTCMRQDMRSTCVVGSQANISLTMVLIWSTPLIGIHLQKFYESSICIQNSLLPINQSIGFMYILSLSLSPPQKKNRYTHRHSTLIFHFWVNWPEKTNWLKYLLWTFIMRGRDSYTYTSN